MSKSRILFFVILVGLATTVSFAALNLPKVIFEGPSAQKPPSGSTPLSSDEFVKQVNNKAKEAQSDVVKQTSNNLNQQESQIQWPNKNAVTPPPAPTSSTQQSTTTKTTTTSTPSGLGTVSVSGSETVSGTSVVSGTESAPPAAPVTMPPSSSKTKPSAPVVQAPSAPSQSQVYTGFGGGNNNTPAPSQPSSGGWNIKY